MENFEAANRSIIEQSYIRLFDKICAFISSRIADIREAENLAQDVWVRLLTYSRRLTADTITSFVYAIARNLVNDYLRHQCTRREAYNEIGIERADSIEESVESAVSARQIEKIEQSRIECLPPQRRIIYIMCRFEEKTVGEIASRLSLSQRTVENHLRMGRRDVRRYIAAYA